MKPLSIMFATTFGAVAMATSAQAQNYPWCAEFADGAGVNCGFSTYEQCMATSQGSGGLCTKNNTYTPPAAPTRHAPRKPRPR